MPVAKRPLKICARCLTRRLFSSSYTSRTIDGSPQTLSSTTLPLPPPQTGYTHLTTRALIALSGHDAAQFLQGLTTANIPTSPSPSTPSVPAPAIYSAFLNATGRLLADIFIYPTTNPSPLLPATNTTTSSDPTPSFLLEVDTSQQATLTAYLKRYKLRSKITLRALAPEEYSIYALWDDTARSPLPQSPSSSNVHSYIDTRTPHHTLRTLLPPSSTSGPPSPNTLGFPGEEASVQQYSIRRMLHGIPEGQTELPRESALVQESNIDLMGGVDFRKGCYVGQELVIRTQHRGVVRKRILPVQLYSAEGDKSAIAGVGHRGKSRPEYAPAEGDLAGRLRPGGDVVRTDAKGRSVGRWLGGVGNVGLALCRLEGMGIVDMAGERTKGEEEGRRFGFKGEGEGGGEERGIGVRPFVPTWLAERLWGGKKQEKEGLS